MYGGCEYARGRGGTYSGTKEAALVLGSMGG